MKKSLVLGILGLATAAVTSYGQGLITLDNYNSHGGSGGGPIIAFGAGVPLDGVGGALGTIGAGIGTSWTVGIYFVVGTPVVNDPAGSGLPDAQLGLGAGTGSTVQAGVYGGGFYLSATPFMVNSSGSPATITAEIVAYPTAVGSYAAALNRGHSAPFVMTSVDPLTPTKPLTGNFMAGFSVLPVPEPTTLALGGLGGLALLLLRRKQS